MIIYLCDDELTIQEEIYLAVSGILPEANVSTYTDGKQGGDYQP